MGSKMDWIEEKVVQLAHIFRKVGYKESQPLTTQALKELR
uniref:Uncharacterized protein n=1 Tax=Nelumbo nucifera TaxID=4432 RepID=A0A822ZEN4_NELNU|nr:TPA_asm: hypothetical protein HUJ06_001822 [Nelumbo nucifera]